MQNEKHIVDDPSEGEVTSDPMDIWLKQQLGGLHSDLLADELPGELGKLAAALEARLRGAPAPAPEEAEAEGADPDPDPAAGNGG